MPSFLSHKYKLIFCHVPRTGGTSFTEAIKPYLGQEDEIDTFPKHQPLKDFMKGRLSYCFDRYLKVSIWRNPKSRQRSLKIGAALAPEPIPDDDPYYWMTNYDFLCLRGKMLVDVLINFETLPDSAVKFLSRIGVDVTEFPHLNKRA